MIKCIRSLAEAGAYLDEIMALHPERDGLAAVSAAREGRRRKYAVLTVNYLQDPSDRGTAVYDWDLPTVDMPECREAEFARRIVAQTAPLQMLNPVTCGFGIGEGPGTLVTCFGIPLNPETANGPAFTKTIRQVLSEPAPDPSCAGMMAEMHEQIEHAREHLPERFVIAMPDIQGPFNLAHAIVGEEIMLAPYDDPEACHALMERITTFWLAARRNLVDWIGDDRLPWGARSMAHISECSVNLVSEQFYREFILPHDRRIADAYEGVHIHPCSGPHVFHATLNLLPNVVGTEAGWIERTAAGAISVDEALATIGDRPIFLGIGQELPEGAEVDFICRDLDRYAETPRLLFGYTGMHWRKKDIPRIVDIHRKLDAYWAERYGDGTASA